MANTKQGGVSQQSLRPLRNIEFCPRAKYLKLQRKFALSIGWWVVILAGHCWQVVWLDTICSLSEQSDTERQRRQLGGRSHCFLLKDENVQF